MATSSVHPPSATTISEHPAAGRAAPGIPSELSRDDGGLPATQAVPRIGRRDSLLADTIQTLDLSPIQRTYLLDRWLGQLTYLGKSARTAQRRYYALRLIAIIGGVAIPALVGLNVNGDGRVAVSWLTFGLGLLVAGAVALEEFFRFGERWRHFRRQSELLRSEGWAFLERAGPTYRRYESHAAAFRPFVADVEEIIRHEVGVYVTEVVRVSEDQPPRQAGSGGLPNSSTPTAKPSSKESS